MSDQMNLLVGVENVLCTSWTITSRCSVIVSRCHEDFSSGIYHVPPWRL